MNRVGQYRQWLSDVKFPEYRFHIYGNTTGCYLYASYDEKDTVTGVMDVQETRRWILAVETTKSQFIATCFKCVLTSMEHRTREWFTYRNRAIYQPHYDVDVLHGVCEERILAAPGEPQA